MKLAKVLAMSEDDQRKYAAGVYCKLATLRVEELVEKCVEYAKYLPYSQVIKDCLLKCKTYTLEVHDGKLISLVIKQWFDSTEDWDCEISEDFSIEMRFGLFGLDIYRETVKGSTHLLEVDVEEILG